MTTENHDLENICFMAGPPIPPLTYAPIGNNGLIAGLIEGNQRLLSRDHKALFLEGVGLAGGWLTSHNMRVFNHFYMDQTSKMCEKQGDPHPQEEFDQALAKLPSTTSQMLWKAFEANRKETGTEGGYKEG